VAGGGEVGLARAFVGRNDDLAALQEAARAGGAVRVVRGPAGIGKTRLVRELTASVVARGGVVLTGRCTTTAVDVPLRPLREALLRGARGGLRPSDALAAFVPTLARLVPEWGEAGSAPESPLIVAEAVLRLLAGTGAVLAVDDVQWADRETLAVLEYLADNVGGLPVFVVATLRDGEPGAGTDAVTALVASRAAAELRLGPLGADDVVAVARSCLGGASLPEDVAATVVDRSEGVPFLVEELVATASSGWVALADTVPGSVVASVDVRLAALPPDGRRLLAAAAVLGRQFDWVVAARAAEVAEVAAGDLLRRAARAQLVDVDGSGFRFRHALTRDAVLALAGPADHVVIARRALAALESVDPALSGERLQLAAALAEVAGDGARAAALLLRAAQRAVAEGSLASADALATAAVERGGGTAAELLVLRVCALSGQPERAAVVGDALLAGRGPDDAGIDDAARAEVHLLLGGAALAAGDWEEAERHAAGARELDTSTTARATALAAQAAMGRDDVDTAALRAVEALTAARAAGLPEVQCEALEVIGRVERGRDLPAAAAAFGEALEVATRAGSQLWRVRALQELGTVDLFSSLATEHLDRARREAVAMGALATAAVVDLQLGALHNERGELDLALDAARRCEESSRRFGLATLAMGLTIQAMVHARAGRRAEMQAALDAAYACGGDPEYVEIGAWSNVVPILELVVGDLPAAAAGLDRAMAALRRRPAATFPFPGMWALVHTLLGDGADARAEARALRFDTPVSREMLDAADAVALGRDGDRAGAADRWAIADAALAEHGGGFRRAFVRLLVAPAALRDGWGDPIAWLRESLAVFDGLGLDALALRCRAVLRGADQPVPRRGRGDVDVVPPALAALGITGREVDVLGLVARGHTNREVGERLCISARTVDKHVERLLRKAGTDRAGLAALAGDAGLLRP
jgi:DNA-binding CsgD family transcriptional regulator/tetratricopeptide (TPR) repeat protein